MNVVQGMVLGALRLYKLAVSPLLHTLVGPFGGCRFHPTCSVYTADAVRQHGALNGSALAARRMCRCHPWGGCGDDPVPSQFQMSLRKGTTQ